MDSLQLFHQSTFTGQEEELIEAMAEVVNNEKSTKSKENMNVSAIIYSHRLFK